MSWMKWFDPGFYEIRRLRKEVVEGPYVEVNVLGYSVCVVHRGDNLLYAEIERAILVAVDLRCNNVLAKSINYLDNGRPVLVTEKKLIIERILKYMLAFQKIVMEVV